MNMIRHRFVSIVSANIISCIYSHIFLRNTSVSCLTNQRYSKVASVFDVNTNNKCISGLHLSNKCFLFVNKLPHSNFRSISTIKAKNLYSMANRDIEVTKSLEGDKLWIDSALNVTHPAFDKLSGVYLSDLDMVATTYRHKASGLSVVSLKTNIQSGKEMCFDIFVPTPPVNSRGSAHVLEHTVLSGSSKYPSKDGFSVIIQGGFYSFLNASTYKDKTSYLFASTNEKSFYNIADFYMESFFRPSVRQQEDIFKQEGWHYKVLPNDKNETEIEDGGIVLHDRHISYSGIVYNEMRNSFSDSHNIARSLIYENLFNNCYKFVSGGNPEDVVELTHSELIKFYEDYYGPKTATIYFHGPYDISNRLNFVDDYLTKYKIGIELPGINTLSHSANLETSRRRTELEPYTDIPKTIKSTYNALNSVDDLVVMGWILDPKDDKNSRDIDVIDIVGLQVLQHLLIGTPESMLYKALIDSKLGKKVIPTGVIGSYHQSTFMVGLEGVDSSQFETRGDSKDKVEKVILDTFKSAIENGFKLDSIHAAINTIEFEMRELNTGYYPKGLALVELIQSRSQYGKDPLGLLEFDKLLSQLRDRIFKDDPSKYFKDLLNKYFVTNNTRVTLHLEAVESSIYEKDFNKRISKHILSRLGHLKKEDVDRLENEYKKFKEIRETPEDKKVLESFPTLEISDMSPEEEIIPTEFYVLSKLGISKSSKLHDSKVNVLIHPIESQGIVYLDYAISLVDLTVEDLSYLNLFVSMLKEAGTEKLTPEELNYVIAKNLGGLSFDINFITRTNNTTYSDPKDAIGYLVVRAKSLKEKKDMMVDIVNDVLLNSKLSNSNKGIEIINRMISYMQNSIISDGNQYAARRMASKFSVADHADEVANGYAQLKILKETILPTAEADWSQIEKKLNSIRKKLLQLNHVTVNITGNSTVVNDWVNNYGNEIYKKLQSTFLESSSSSKTSLWVNEILEKGLMNGPKDEVIVVPTRVNYVGIGGPLFDTGDFLNGEDSLVVHYIHRMYLFKHVRMSLGAYGVSANITSTGHIIFMSFADPNFDKTIEVYKNTPNVLHDAHKSLDERELLRQKIGKMSSLDRPLHVETKGFVALLRILKGETKETRLKIRREILGAGIDCFDRVMNKFNQKNDWTNVCAVINQATAKDLPSHITKLNMP